ncbi:MAG: hypothetical protein JW806_03750 [Sedimentisphaerales bacterium]|nr:hypothetical protein [Sedimentisphaerales bacterium]
MIVLLCFNFFGALSSFLTHLCLLLDFSLPSGKIAIVLNIGLGTLFFIRIAITKGLQQEKRQVLKDALRNLCPYWLKLIVSLIVVYGIATCIFSLGMAFSEISVAMKDSTVASRSLYIGVFSLIMVCYTIEFLVVYLYENLKQTELRKLKKDGFVY